MRLNSIYNHDYEFNHKYNISEKGIPQKTKQSEYSNRFAQQQG